MERFFELLGCAGGFLFATFANDAGVGICDGGEEVGCRLAVRAFEAEVFKVWFRVVGGAEEDTSSFIDYEDFIEQLALDLKGKVGKLLQRGLHRLGRW